MKSISKIFAVATLALSISACNGGGGNKPNDGVTPASKTSERFSCKSVEVVWLQDKETGETGRVRTTTQTDGTRAISTDADDRQRVKAHGDVVHQTETLEGLGWNKKLNWSYNSERISKTTVDQRGYKTFIGHLKMTKLVGKDAKTSEYFFEEVTYTSNGVTKTISYKVDGIETPVQDFSSTETVANGVTTSRSVLNTPYNEEDETYRYRTESSEQICESRNI